MSTKIKSSLKIIGSIIALIFLILVIGFFVFGFIIAPLISRIDPFFFENISNINSNNSSFESVPELIVYLKSNNISNREYTSDYTCKDFAKDFIQQAKNNGYQCFTLYALYGNELDNFNSALSDNYLVFVIPGAGHAVVKTTINGTELIIDSQTDIVMNAKNFTVLYEGEIIK